MINDISIPSLSHNTFSTENHKSRPAIQVERRNARLKKLNPAKLFLKTWSNFSCLRSERRRVQSVNIAYSRLHQITSHIQTHHDILDETICCATDRHDHTVRARRKVSKVTTLVKKFARIILNKK